MFNVTLFLAAVWFAIVGIMCEVPNTLSYILGKVLPLIFAGVFFAKLYQ